MFRSKAIPVCSAISLGIGAYIGRNFDRLTSVDHESESRPNNYLPLPTVAASSNVLVPADAKNLPSAVPPATNRVSEIMRFGFPGLADVRTYDDFVLSYDRRNRTAMWVFEHLTPERFNYANGVDRSKSQFQEDNSVHEYFRASNTDYKNSGYDRGHLAAASNHRNSQKAIDQTFLLSNISPQVGEGFNRDAWNDLEKYTRAVARKNQNVYVCTGPLYLPRREADGKLYVKYEVIGKNHVAVPTHFFKVLLIEDQGGKLELQSFVMPNAALPKDVPLKSYLVPLDSIERAAGLLIFSQLPNKLLSKVNGKQV